MIIDGQHYCIFRKMEDTRNAAIAIAAMREDAKLLKLCEFVEKEREGGGEKLMVFIDKEGIFSRKVKSDEDLNTLMNGFIVDEEGIIRRKMPSDEDITEQGENED